MSEHGHIPNRRELFGTVALRVSNELRALLPLTEDEYRRLALEAQNNARAYYVYSVLDATYEAGVAMTRWEDLLSDKGTIHEDRRTHDVETRLVHQSVEAEGALWKRRLMEALVNLINFSATNEEIFYRHWLFLDQFQAMAFLNKDNIDYFACDSRQLTKRIGETVSTIRAIEKSIDIARCWYLRERRVLPSNPRPTVLASFAENLRTAIPIAKPRERTELGISYQQFSTASDTIHFSPGGTRYELESTLSDHFSHCALLVNSILLRIIDLLDLKPDPTSLAIRMVQAYESNTLPDEGSERLTTDRARVGDFVVVRTSLARVLAVNTSAYGYESYKIRYLADAPHPDLLEDDVLPFHVHRLFEAERIKQRLLVALQSIDSDISGTEVDALKTIDADLDASVQRAWALGLRATVMGSVRPIIPVMR